MQHLSDNTELPMQRGASISNCRQYRYCLWREWDRIRPTIAFLMLNPSTADHLTKLVANRRAEHQLVRRRRRCLRARDDKVDPENETSI